MRSLNFLRKKPKNKEDADASKNEDADKTVEEEKAEEEQPKEDKPVVDYDLLSAMASLSPGKSYFFNKLNLGSSKIIFFCS